MPNQRERYSNGGTTTTTGPRPIKGFFKKVASAALNRTPVGKAINVIGTTSRIARGTIKTKGPVNVGGAVTGRLGSRIKARKKARKAAKKTKT